MPFLIWKNQYSVNVETFDNQHKELFELINQLESSVKKNSPRKVVKQAIQGLMDYTETHFACEENNMISYQYPQYESHKKAHDQFKETVFDLRKKMESGGANPYELLKLLMDWLVKHIMKMDRQYSDFFKDKKIL